MIPHNRPTLGEEEKIAVSQVIDSNWLAQGKEVEDFENEFCDYFGLSKGHAVAVSSGTSALYLALWVLGAKDKKVVFPAYVCTAIRNAVSFAGAKEIIVDNKKYTPNIDVSRINNVNADIAIVPHIYGIPVDTSAIKTDCVIEDCCQSIGAQVNGIKAGLQSEISIFSFYATKLITSGGQGGMVLSKNINYINKIKDYRDFDQKNDGKARFNFQMTNTQAAIGRVQLKKLPHFLERRQEIFQKYKNAGFHLLDSDNLNVMPIRYRAVLRNKNIKKIISKLHEEGIKAINPHEDWELLTDLANCPNAHQLTKETISLPIYPSLKDEEINHIIDTLIKIL